MLANPELFQIVEDELKKQGVIQRFEEEQGEIIGRMMITLGDVPDDLKDEIEISDGDYVFIGTFDFYDASVGIVLNHQTMTVKSGLWITPQESDAEPPSEDWCNFFVQTIAKNINKDGSFGYPLYTFCASVGDFTCVPTNPDGE